MNSQRHMIFGAPGAGKSTLLRHLPLHGECTSVDLEEIGGKENYHLPENFQTERNLRKQHLERLRQTDCSVPLFVGCADVDPCDFPPEFKVIFLHHKDPEKYFAWVAKRDDKHPEKKGQEYDRMYKEMIRFKERGNYTHEFDPSEFAERPDDLARAIWVVVNGLATDVRV